VVSRAWTVQWYGFCFCRRISFIASDKYGADGTRSKAFSYCLVSMKHDLAHRDFLSAFQQIFHGLLVCNARKRKHSRKTAINFPSDGRFRPVFFSWNENDKNYVMGGEFSWFDLTIKLHKKQSGFQGLNSPMVWIPLLPSHLLHRFWHLQGRRNMISSIFVLSSLYIIWSSPLGFSVHIPTKFSSSPGV